MKVIFSFCLASCLCAYITPATQAQNPAANESKIRAAYDHFNATHDLDLLHRDLEPVNQFHPDIAKDYYPYWFAAGSGQGTDLATQFDNFLLAAPDAQWHLKQVQATANKVKLEVHCTGTLVREFYGNKVTGRPFDAIRKEVWTFDRNGALISIL
jgi:hypothetical protein